MKPHALSERRAADRAKMASLLVEAMTRAGAEAVIEPRGSREIAIRIMAPGGAYVVVDFSGDSPQPNVHVVTWNTPRAVFLNPAIGDVNPYHFGKATRVCHGIDRLIETLAIDVARFIDRSGYLAHDDARILAMREHYRQNGWKWVTE